MQVNLMNKFIFKHHKFVIVTLILSILFRLPRVIICGNTEDNFPKLVVADSRPQSRGNKCLQKLTGKLTESLTLQEKLAKENAQLEGGK